MPKPEVDWPKDNKFELIEAGEYPIECTKVELKTSKSTGREYYNLEYTIQGGDYDGRRIWDIISFKGDTPEKTKSALSRVSLIAHRLGGVRLEAREEFDPHSLLGQRWYVSIIKEVRQGEERNSIPFAGYREREDDDQTPEPDGSVPVVDDDSDLPF